ncbi:hypothetical protein ADUPG1_012445, partial [Aduncisulcus paluster]
LNDVFEALTRLDPDSRMSVLQCNERIQPIKYLLPKIGEGWECPSLADIIDEQLRSHDGCVGTIESEHPKEGDHPKQDGQHPKEGLAGMEIEQGWDKSQEIIYQSNVLSSSFTHINIPFYEPSPVKGGYIRLFDCFGFPLTSSHLIFTFSTTSKETVFKKFEFPEFEYLYWCFLPVDLFDVTACEITGQGRCSSKKIGKEKLDFHFQITSLVFISREETPEEIIFREAREKLWSKSAVVKPEFMKEGDEES